MLNVRLEEPIPEPDAYMEKPPEADHLLRLTEDLIGR
jgi:hypothetical protein